MIVRGVKLFQGDQYGIKIGNSLTKTMIRGDLP